MRIKSLCHLLFCVSALTHLLLKGSRLIWVSDIAFPSFSPLYLSACRAFDVSTNQSLGRIAEVQHHTWMDDFCAVQVKNLHAAGNRPTLQVYGAGFLRGEVVTFQTPLPPPESNTSRPVMSVIADGFKSPTSVRPGTGKGFDPSGEEGWLTLFVLTHLILFSTVCRLYFPPSPLPPTVVPGHSMVVSGRIPIHFPVRV